MSRSQKNRTLVFAAICIALPCVLVLLPLVSTLRRMGSFRTHVTPGMTVVDLEKFAGKPSKIVRQGERLGAATRSYRLPALDERTVVYFYPKEGTPYFNVYVFVDQRQSVVLSSVVENLWW